MQTTYGNVVGEGENWFAFHPGKGIVIEPTIEVRNTATGETKTYPLREGDSGKGNYIIVHLDTQDITTTDELEPEEKG